jgi:hypothetical protein
VTDIDPVQSYNSNKAGPGVELSFKSEYQNEVAQVSG